MPLTTIVLVCFALGLRHGMDPDHLAVIDHLSRTRPNRWNGVWFALGHGIVVTVLAAGVGATVARWFEPFSPCVLIATGGISLWRVFRQAEVGPSCLARLWVASPFLLGMLLAAGFETSSQLAALAVAGRLPWWLLGLSFCAGMTVVDGLDGYLATKTQMLALRGYVRATQARRILSALVATAALSLGVAGLAGVEPPLLALPLSVVLLVAVVGLRLWSAFRAPVYRSHAEIGL